MNSSAWSLELNEINKLKLDFIIENSRLLKEIETLGTVQNDEVALLYCRRALEVIITEICEEKLCRDRGTEPLKSIIDRLIKDKIIPDYIHTSMQNLNSIANYGAHPKDFDSRQVRTALIELVTVLDWYFKEKNYKTIAKSKENNGKGKITETLAPPLLINKEYQPSPIRKKMTVRMVFLISSIVITAILIVVFFVNKKNYVKSGTKIIDSNINQALNAKPIDTLSKPKNKKVIVKPNIEIPSEKTEKEIDEPQKTNRLIPKEIKKAGTNQVAQPKAIADIGMLIKKLTNTAKPFDDRKKAMQQLIPEFEKNAVVTITIGDQVVDKMLVLDYFNRLLTLKGVEVEIIKQENGITGKIEVLNVLEKKH